MMGSVECSHREELQKGQVQRNGAKIVRQILEYISVILCVIISPHISSWYALRASWTALISGLSACCMGPRQGLTTSSRSEPEPRERWGIAGNQRYACFLPMNKPTEAHRDRPLYQESLKRQQCVMIDGVVSWCILCTSTWTIIESYGRRAGRGMDYQGDGRLSVVMSSEAHGHRRRQVSITGG